MYTNTMNVPRYENERDGPPTIGSARIPSSTQPRPTSSTEPGDDPLLGEDQLPRVDTHDVAGPQAAASPPRYSRAFHARRRAQRHEVRERPGENRTGQSHHTSPSRRFGPRCRGWPALNSCPVAARARTPARPEAREVVEQVEALEHQREDRAEVDDADPQHRRQHERQPRPPTAAGRTTPRCAIARARSRC